MQDDLAAFREIRFLRDLHTVYACFGIRELIDVKSVSFVTVNIIAERGEHAVQIRRATGAAEHLDALCDGEALFMIGRDETLVIVQIDLQRIFVEEALSVQRKSRDHAVIEDPFNQIGIDGIVFKAEHSVREEHQRDCRAGLGVGFVVDQIVIDRERFEHSGGADAARDIHFLRRDILEKRLAGFVELAVVRFISEICHGGIHIAGAYTMSRGFRLFADGEMGLRTFWNADIFIAAAVDEMLRELQVAEIPRRSVHTDESKLDLLMPGRFKLRRFFGHESFFNTIRVFFHQLQKAVFARCLVISDGGFHQMSRAVKLVPISDGEALFGRARDEIGIEIAVFTLIFLDLVDDRFDLCLQIGIVFPVQNISRALHPFRYVGVPENMGLFRLSLLPIATEGGNSARIVKTVVYGVDGDVFVQNLFIVQKAVFQNDVLKWNRDHRNFLRRKNNIESHSHISISLYH